MTRFRFVILLLVLLAVGGKSFAAPTSVQPPDFESIFAGYSATFLLYDLQNDTLITYNPTRANIRYAPHSTFKIPNAAIGLEAGSVADEDEIIAWDSEKYPLTNLPDQLPFSEWRKANNLRSGMRYSVVWFYTELALRTGQDTMQQWLDTIDYGNRDISAWMGDGAQPAPFWLRSSLEISANEQLRFLVDFYNGEVGFSERTTAIVKDIIILEETADYRLSGKTGTAGESLSWLVGYIQRDDNTYFYIMNMAAPGDVRNRLVHQTLVAAGLLPDASNPFNFGA